MTDIYGVRVEIDSRSAQSSLANLRTSLLSANQSLLSLQSSVRGISPGLASRVNSISGAFSAFAGTLTKTTSGIALLSAGIAGLVILLGVKLFTAIKNIVRPFVEAADKVTMFQSRLKILSGTEVAFNNLVKSVERFNISLEAGGSVAQRFIMMRNEIGLTVVQAQALADNFVKIGVISGASAEAFQIAALQFSQALGSGRLQGDELRSIMEAMPFLGKVLAENIGTSVGNLKKMGAEGKLTSDIIANGILKATRQLNELYEKMPVTMTMAAQKLSTQLELLYAYLGKLTGVYDLWVKIVTAAADYTKKVRAALGDMQAMGDAVERIKQAQEEIQRLQSKKADIQASPSSYTYLGMYQNAQRIKEIDKEIEDADKRRIMAQNSLIAQLRAEDEQALKDLADIEEERVKKFTGNIRELSRELSDALGDLSLYDSLDKRIAKVVGRFDELRKKVNELPGATEKIKAAMNANLDAFERQQITIETVTFGAEKEREIQKKINELIEKRPQLLKDVSDASKMYGIPRELILGVMATESNFSNSAVSNKGASGLMQLMPATARDMGVKDIFDQRQNIFGGVKYLAEQLKDFQGNLDLALAAYNAGPAAVRKAGGIPQFKDTLAYIPKVKEAASIIQSMGDTFDKTMEGFRMEALKEGTANLNTASNAADKFKKNVEQLVLYSEVYPEKIAPGEELAREILKAKDAYLDATDPNRKFVEGILQQEDAAKGNGLTIRAEQINEIKKRTKDAADQLDPFNAKTAEYQRQIEKSVATTAYYEQLREVGVQLKEVARAQEQFTIENELAIKVVASGAASEKEYQRWLYVRKNALEDLAEPNKKMLDDLEAELAIYRRFASSDDGERRIQQAMAIRSALASVNRADPNYETTAGRVKEMTAELEAFKEQMSLVNDQAELFKNAATGIYETWTGAFESIFDKGLEGFTDMKDQILALFKKLLAQMIATAAARPVMVPLIQTMGETFGLQGTARELVKQFGGPIPATAGTMAATPVGGGIPLARQANDLPSAGMAPGWAYGAAGLGGYLAGNYLGGGSPMSQFGGAAGALGGAFVGGKYGSLLGTAITPGIGTALGAIVGGLAGTLLGSLFGGGGDKQPSPRARFGQGRGGQFSTTTPFGIAGFSELRVEHGMDQELWNQGREFLATIRDFEESIAQVLDPAEIQRVKDALANFKSDSTDFAGILKNRIAVIADAINLSYRTLLGDTSKMDTEAIAERLGILKELENALTRTIDDIAEAAAIQSGGYDIQIADTLSKLKDEFDRWTGSTPQLQAINDLVEDRYQLELDRLAEIKSVTEDLQQGTADLLRDLEQTGMTQSELLADWRKQMGSAMEAISGLTDPEKIRETVADYQEAAQAAFKVLSDLLAQFDSARESITKASLSRATAIRRGGMSSADQSMALQAEFAQRQAALQAATTPGEVTDAFNDLQTTLNDWLAVEQNLLAATEGQTRTLEDLTQAIDDAKKTISQSAIEQARSIRYSVLKPNELIAALQSDFATQQSAIRSANTPEAITEAYTAIQNTLQEWMQAEQSAIQAANAELQTAEELQKTVDDLRKGLREFIDNLKTSNLSPLRPSEKLAESQQQYMNLLNKAKVGDTEALSTVGNAAQEYLNQAREFYASSPNYTAIFKSVTDTLTILQQQFTANTATSDEESRLRSLAETFAQRLESVSQDAMNSLATLSVTQAQSGISALAETFAQRFELVAQDALNRLASLQAEQLGSIGNLNELADQFKSGISEMTRLAQDQLKALQDSALARYQEFTAALDETLRDGAGVLSESLRAAFDAGAAAIADAVSGQFAAASQPTATIIPFPTRVAAAANVATAENQAELEQKLDAVVDALGRIGVIVQVSTKEQTRELIQSRPVEYNSGTAATTKQVF